MSKRNDKTDEANCRYCGVGHLMTAVESVTMVGGYVARLCPDCRNTWHLFINDHPVRAELRALERLADMLQMRVMGDGVDRSKELNPILDRAHDIGKQLFDIADQWLSGDVQQGGA